MRECTSQLNKPWATRQTVKWVGFVGPGGFEPPKLAQLVYSQSPLATWVQTPGAH